MRNYYQVHLGAKWTLPRNTVFTRTRGCLLCRCSFQYQISTQQSFMFQPLVRHRQSNWTIRRGKISNKRGVEKARALESKTAILPPNSAQRLSSINLYNSCFILDDKTGTKTHWPPGGRERAQPKFWRRAFCFTLASLSNGHTFWSLSPALELPLLTAWATISSQDGRAERSKSRTGIRCDSGRGRADRCRTLLGGNVRSFEPVICGQGHTPLVSSDTKIISSDRSERRVQARMDLLPKSSLS